MVATAEVQPPQQIETKPFDRAQVLRNIQTAEERWKSNGFPVALKSDDVEAAIAQHDLIRFEAETGSGKSTVGPSVMLRWLLSQDPNGKMVVTQPRRVATESVANHVGEKIGEEFVDYRYKGHADTKPNARIIYMIDKSLEKELNEGPELKNYDMVMVDEVHEHSINIYTILPMLKRAQQLRRERGMKPLKVVLASGTLAESPIIKYFPEAYKLETSGRAFDVHSHFSPNDIQIQDIPREAAKIAKNLMNDPKNTGDILIFMPGRGEIQDTIQELGITDADPTFEVMSLTGGDKEGDPYKKIKNNPQNKRRIYVATNVAETSITIPGITKVILSGYARVNEYDKDTQVTTLRTIKQAKANIIQSKGRAGRVQEGDAYMLFTEEDYKSRPQAHDSEFLRTDLTPQLLNMKAAGIDDVYNFPYIEHPGKEKIDQFVSSLQKLGALDKAGNITPLGREMAEIKEEDPHFARMLIEGKKRNCLPAVAVLIGLMKVKESLFEFDRNRENFFIKFASYIDHHSDFITAINVWNDFQANRKSEEGLHALGNKGVNVGALKSIAGEVRDLLDNDFFSDQRIRYNAPIDISSDEQKEAINIAIASGLMDKLLVKDAGDKYKFAEKATADIQIERSSVLGKRFPQRILSGKIRSIEREGKKRAFTSMNMDYDQYQNQIQQAFQYLTDILGKPAPDENKGVIKQAEPQEKPQKPQEQPISQKQTPVLSPETVKRTIETVHKAPPKHDKHKSLWKQLQEGLHKLGAEAKAIVIKVLNTIAP